LLLQGEGVKPEAGEKTLLMGSYTSIEPHGLSKGLKREKREGEMAWTLHYKSAPEVNLAIKLGAPNFPRRQDLNLANARKRIVKGTS